MTASSMLWAAGAALLLAGCAPRVTVSDAPRPRPAEDAGRAAAPLVVPVEGVAAGLLRDSYNDGRAGGRLHRAIDIAAPQGTPVVAAAAGTVRQLKDNALGGTTALVVTADGRTVHYYAHLDRYADGLREGQTVRAGQRLGYVGTTGNAQGAHLHFAAWRIADAAKFWQGEVFNPFPLFQPPAPPMIAEAERPAERPSRPAAAARPSRPAPADTSPATVPARRGW